MPKKIKDFFTGDLFDPDREPPKLLKRHPEDPKKQIDDDGNIYDEMGNLIKEKPSKYLTQAIEIFKKNYPGEEVRSEDARIRILIRHLQHLDNQKNKKEEKKNS